MRSIAAKKMLLSVVVALLLHMSSSLALADSSDASSPAAAACSSHHHDVSEVRNELRYTGPQQKIHREGKLNFRCFNAQHWEDLYMLQHYFANVSNGFFIELGALDGWSYSVTYFFEQFLNWRGLLIEASPKNFLQFKNKMRKLPARRRRKSEFILSAVCNDPKPLTYVSKEGTGAGILEFMPEDQQIRNKKMCTEATLPPPQQGVNDAATLDPVALAAAESPSSCTLTRIQCIHLGELLRKRGVKKVDMFVLDVEGAELEVLATLFLDEIPVHFFLIELDGKSPAKDAAVRCILRRHNYVPIGRLELNEIWRKNDFDVAKYADSYGAPVPVSSWSGCFKTPVDQSFFVGNEHVIVSGAAHGQQPRGDADAVGMLDADFAEFNEADGMKQKMHEGSDKHSGGVHPHFYGYVEDANVGGVETTTVFFWILVLGVPIGVAMLRRRHRRKGVAA